jgi:hypothetical protein
VKTVGGTTHRWSVVIAFLAFKWLGRFIESTSNTAQYVRTILMPCPFLLLGISYMVVRRAISQQPEVWLSAVDW